MDLKREGYWDEHYQLELRNYEDAGDEGEVWFGKGLNLRIVKWLIKRIITSLRKQIKVSFVDIGCGNAFTLYTLYESLLSEHHFTPVETNNLTIIGLDYAISSIDLSRKILTDKGIADKVKVQQCDFLDTKQVSDVTASLEFDYIVDKGTFDAICLLSSESDELLQKAKLKYMESLYSLVGQRSIFIMASCNHTEDELLSLFKIDCSARKESKLVDRIESPKIQFGGKEGSQVTCIIMELEHQEK